MAKGLSEFLAQISVGAFVLLLSVAITSHLTSTLFMLGQTGPDVGAVEDLSSAANNKCQDVKGLSEDSDSSNIQPINMENFELQQAEVELNQVGETRYELRGVFDTSRDPVSVTLEGCEFQMSVENSENNIIKPGGWSVVISHQSGTSNPPVINIEVNEG